MSRTATRRLFLEFVEASLRGKETTTFYEDEFRCPIAAVDLARHVLVLAASKPGTARGVFNAGGPDRLSRVDMAKRAAEALRLSDRNVAAASAAAASDRGVASPLDISMDSAKLERAIGVRASGWALQARTSQRQRWAGGRANQGTVIPATAFVTTPDETPVQRLRQHQSAPPRVLQWMVDVSSSGWALRARTPRRPRWAGGMENQWTLVPAVPHVAASDAPTAQRLQQHQFAPQVLQWKVSPMEANSSGWALQARAPCCPIAGCP